MSSNGFSYVHHLDQCRLTQHSGHKFLLWEHYYANFLAPCSWIAVTNRHKIIFQKRLMAACHGHDRQVILYVCSYLIAHENSDCFQKYYWKTVEFDGDVAYIGRKSALTIKANEMHCFSILFDKVLYMFRTGPLSIIRSISTLYTQQYVFVMLVMLTVC